MGKFKVGDRVRVIDGCEPYYSKGDTGTKFSHGSVKFDPSTTVGSRNDRIWSATDSRLELIEEPKMNRLKGLKLKFDVTDNPELSEAIQRRVFELGGSWANEYIVQHTRAAWLFIGSCSNGLLTWSNEPDVGGIKLGTLDDLYHLPSTHTITLGDKDVEISHESFLAFQEQFK